MAVKVEVFCPVQRDVPLDERTLTLALPVAETFIAIVLDVTFEGDAQESEDVILTLITSPLASVDEV